MNDHLSILLPVKNGEKYIQSSLLSLMKSCRVGDEILVVDDYSIDSTSKIVKQMCGEDSRIKLIKNRESGIVGALNLGVYESVNSWVARVDVDDKYDLNRLEIQRANLQVNTVGIFSDYDFFSESQNFLNIDSLCVCLNVELFPPNLKLSDFDACTTPYFFKHVSLYCFLYSSVFL
jgi:glycosyltransferase involved in cell wall biosynthesis